MGRPRLTTEEVTNKFQDIKELLDELKEKRASAKTDAEKNELTKKISSMKKNLSLFKKRNYDRLLPTVKKMEKQPKEKLVITQPTLREKLEEIRNKAKLMISQAKSPEEIKSIQEGLNAVELRYKYSYY